VRRLAHAQQNPGPQGLIRLLVSAIGNTAGVNG
jgi:hypothetical protein